jgi:hypothetical protein
MCVSSWKKLINPKLNKTKQIYKVKILKTKRSTKMKLRLLSIMILFLALGLKAQKSDFSGTWIRNTDKCDAGNLSLNSIPVEITVIQNTGQIEIKRISKDYQGDTTQYSEKIKFDGTSATSVIRSNVNKKASIQWSPDQKGFTENAAYADDQGNTKQNAKETWVLTDNGKTLQILLTLTLNGQDYLLTEIFDKS